MTEFVDEELQAVYDDLLRFEKIIAELIAQDEKTEFKIPSKDDKAADEQIKKAKAELAKPRSIEKMMRDSQAALIEAIKKGEEKSADAKKQEDEKKASVEKGKTELAFRITGRVVPDVPEMAKYRTSSGAEIFFEREIPDLTSVITPTEKQRMRIKAIFQNEGKIRVTTADMTAEGHFKFVLRDNFPLQPLTEIKNTAFAAFFPEVHFEELGSGVLIAAGILREGKDPHPYAFSNWESLWFHFVPTEKSRLGRGGMRGENLPNSGSYTSKVIVLDSEHPEENYVIVPVFKRDIASKEKDAEPSDTKQKDEGMKTAKVETIKDGELSAMTSEQLKEKATKIRDVIMKKMNSSKIKTLEDKLQSNDVKLSNAGYFWQRHQIELLSQELNQFFDLYKQVHELNEEYTKIYIILGTRTLGNPQIHNNTVYREHATNAWKELKELKAFCENLVQHAGNKEFLNDDPTVKEEPANILKTRIIKLLLNIKKTEQEFETFSGNAPRFTS